MDWGSGAHKQCSVVARQVLEAEDSRVIGRELGWAVEQKKYWLCLIGSVLSGQPLRLSELPFPQL